MPEWKRAAAEERLLLIKPALDRVAMGISVRSAAEWLHIRLPDGGPSLSTLQRYIAAAKGGDIAELAPSYTGRQRKVLGCESLIVNYFKKASQPDCGDISFWLKQDYGLDVSASWIRRYLKSLPSNQAETAPKRLGQHYYDQNIRPHHRRDPDSYAVGEMWVSDGHRLKVISRHPNSQDLFRVEITPILDWTSNFLYGFWEAANESGMDTVYALCRMMRQYDHVPVWFQTDPGPGFDNRRVAALLVRLGITHAPTRAGNARGKGFGEGIFHLVSKRFSKQFETYCGDDRTDDALARMRTKVKRGELYVPDTVELREQLERFRVTYNAWPQKKSDKLRGKSPNDLIGQSIRNPLSIPVTDLLRPSGVAVVSHREIRFANRYYRSEALAAYERRKVIYQYDEFDEREVWIRDSKHRLICVAELVKKKLVARDNVAADARLRSLNAALERNEEKARRIEERFDNVIEGQTVGERVLDAGHSFITSRAVAEPQLKAIDGFELAIPPAQKKEIEGLPPLDLLDTDY